MFLLYSSVPYEVTYHTLCSQITHVNSILLSDSQDEPEVLIRMRLYCICGEKEVVVKKLKREADFLKVILSSICVVIYGLYNSLYTHGKVINLFL